MTNAGEESLIILESLLCLMREKSLLTRGDIELLCAEVGRRAEGEPLLPCRSESAQMAHKYLRQLTTHLGQRYGGKHSRHSANEVALETQKKRHSALRLRQAG